jgi:hypothetical protein
MEESKLVLRIKRQLAHALEKLIPGNAAKISQHEFLDIEPYEIAQFERLDTRGEHDLRATFTAFKSWIALGSVSTI